MLHKASYVGLFLYTQQEMNALFNVTQQGYVLVHILEPYSIVNTVKFILDELYKYLYPWKIKFVTNYEHDGKY